MGKSEERYLEPNPIKPACSNCFKNFGLKLAAERSSIAEGLVCENCGSSKGKNLSTLDLELLAYNFFVRGSLHYTDYGAAPVIQMNDSHETDIEVSESLQHDIEIIERVTGKHLFYYGPRLWMVGEIEPLKELLNKKEREHIAKRIIDKYPTVTIPNGNILYRIRVGEFDISSPTEFDSPPNGGTGRLDSEINPVLYCSPEIELCLHECRVSVEDKIHVAHLNPTRNLRMLDLSDIIEEEGTEFESLDLTVLMLFYAGSHSYPTCRYLGNEIKKAGYDGIIYPSFFSTLKTGREPFETAYGVSLRKMSFLHESMRKELVQNIAIFGRPIESGLLNVECINNLILKTVEYDFSLGPGEY